MKNLKKVMLLLLVSVIVFSLVGCSTGQEDTKPEQENEPAQGNEPEQGKEIDTNRLVKFTYNAIPDSLNPWTLNMEVPTGINSAQIYDTMLKKDFQGNILPGLAEDWDISEDGKTITLKVRQGLKWSTGDPFNAEDVAFSLTSYAENGAFNSVYSDFEKAEVIDEYTCNVTLKNPNVVFISYLTTPISTAIMSKAAHEKWGDEYGKSFDKVACSINGREPL